MPYFLYVRETRSREILPESPDCTESTRLNIPESSIAHWRYLQRSIEFPCTIQSSKCPSVREEARVEVVVALAVHPIFRFSDSNAVRADLHRSKCERFIDRRQKHILPNRFKIRALFQATVLQNVSHFPTYGLSNPLVQYKCEGGTTLRKSKCIAPTAI